MPSIVSSIANSARNLFNRSQALAQSAHECKLELGGRTFRYVHAPARSDAAPTLVLLHPRLRPARAPLLGARGWNLICPIDDFGFRGEGSWFLGEKGDYFWLDAIDRLIADHGTDDLYFAGSNMGGYGAILHGLRHRARAVFAHAPHTALMENAFVHQGLRTHLRTVFGHDRDAGYTDLKTLVETAGPTRFFLSARRGERAQYLAEQIFPFVERLVAADADCEFNLFAGEGNLPPFSYGEIADRLLAVHRGSAQSFFSPNAKKAATIAGAGRRADEPSRLEQADALIETSFLDLPAVWTKPHHHMLERFEMKLEKFSKTSGVEGHAEIHDFVMRQVEARAEDRPRTFFVASPGGSGSHWLQAIMSKNFGAVSCGEVYLPEAMMQMLHQVGPDLRGRMIDAVHIAHAYKVPEDMSETMLINTAHARGWRIAALMPEPKTTILLQRDPLDIVLSRTFRKQDVREKQYSQFGDRDYLDLQIEFVNQFHQMADVSRIDLVVRYEDLKNDLGGALRKMAAHPAMPIDEARIEETIAALKRGEIDANKYRGPKVVIADQHRDHAMRELAALRKRLGYA